MRCPCYLFHRFFLSLCKDTGAPLSPIARGPHELSVRPCWGLATSVMSFDLLLLDVE
ncbi:unnamed protein product [Staurois parvus]|uniref:Uncharacterized protein n=1 Tax=Staurois parvus TaxID=386267 RepID=A0ABN9CMU8_9NEOB|nr:unnamed protein product [Staurois parvus]